MAEKDKSKWHAGPWHEEPDEASWIDAATGYACEARRNHSGAWCGYVRIPQDHPLYGVEYNHDLPMRLHGAMEAAKEGDVGKRGPMEVFCMALNPDSTRVSYLFDVHGSLTYSGADWPAAGFWYGFDCSHCDDLSPAYQTPEEYGYDKRYRDLPYVKAECASLARQLQSLVVPFPA